MKMPTSILYHTAAQPLVNDFCGYGINADVIGHVLILFAIVDAELLSNV